MKLQARRRWIIGAALLAILAVATRLWPQLLLFPHHDRSGPYEVWSEQPISRHEIDKSLSLATHLAAQSPLYQRSEERSIYLTRGGWRWRWLALQSSGAFAVSYPASNAIVVNRNSVLVDRVWNGQAVGGQRSLGRVIAHEMCHGMLRRRFGFAVDFTKPQWLREGYCDHVAQESSLSNADAVELKARGSAHPALPYYEGRRRVEASLSANGGNVDKLFAEAR